MKNTKRVLSMLLAILMVLGVCPLAIFANDEVTGDQTDTATPSEQKPYYTYYVQDGLTFLWSGEDYAIGETEQKVTALVNILNAEQSIDKMMYGRQYYNLAMNDGNGGVKFNPMNYRVVNGGVYVTENYAPILTDVIPTTTVDGVTVLTDMTLEVSQSYFDTVATSTTQTYTPNRLYDGGATWYGPLGNIGHNKMVYKSVVIGSTRYYYGEYANAEGVATPFYFTGSPKTASNAKYTYENGAMTKITDTAVLALINEQANAGTLTVDGAKKSLTASGNNYASFPAIDEHGTMGVMQHNSGPLSSKSYDRAGQLQFLNNTINQAFTTTMIFDYADVAKTTTFDFSVGRDGLSYGVSVEDKAYNAETDYSVGTKFGGTTGTYDNGTADDTSDDVTYTKNETFLGFVGARDNNHNVGTSQFEQMISNAIADEGANFAFTYGTNMAFIMHAIRVYNRPLTNTEIAQNHFVDIAMKLGADLSAYDTILAREDAVEILPSIHAIASGCDEGDFTKEEFEAAIVAAEKEYDTPKYYELYVQDGLTFLWTGEGNKLGENAATTTSITNVLNAEQSITKATNGRMNTEYFPGTTATFYEIDNGVLFVGKYGKLILNDLLPTRKLSDGTMALADMTLEVLQAYPDNYKTSASGTATLNKRGNDGGANYFGPAGIIGYTKTMTGAICVNGAWYAPFTYTNPADATDTKTVYVPSVGSAPQTFSYYDYDAETNTLTELGQLTRLSDAEIATNPEGNTAAALSAPSFGVYGTSNSFASLSPFDAYGDGPIMNWNDGRFSSVCDNYGKPQFMNAQANEVYTTTMIFDYGYEDGDLISTSYSYALGIGRDGQVLSDSTFSGTYDATTDYSTKDKDDDSSNYGFTYGVSTYAVNYYAIRMYDRVLTEAEIAQNNFVDIAMRLDADLLEYSNATEGVKKRIHMAFASYNADDFTAESFAETLAKLLEENGFSMIGGMDAPIEFQGFAGALEYFSGVRAVFEANADTIAHFESAGTKVEYGILVSPTDDPSALTVSYDADGKPVASEGAILRVAYETDGVNNFFADSTTFTLAVTNPANEITVHYESEMCFRAYVTLSDGTVSQTFYCDATGETFGDSVSFTKVYRYLYMNGYGEYSSVKTYGAEIDALLESVKEEKEALEAEMALLGEKIDEIDAYVTLHDDYYANAVAKADDPFVAYYYAHNAYAAFAAIDAVDQELADMTPSAEEKIAALESALAGEEPDADALEMAAILTASFKNELADIKNYTENLAQKEGWIDSNAVITYMSAYLAQNTEEPPESFTLNGKTPVQYALLATEETLYAAETVADAFLYNAGNAIAVVDALFADLLTDGTITITLENNADMDLGTYAITVDENGNITLAGQGDNGAYHAAMKFAALLDGTTEATVEATTGSYKDLTTQTYAADGFLKADGTLDTESAGELNVVFIGGSLTELGKSVWTTGVSEYLQELFPNKTVNHINSGVGGTNSEGAAARFCEHVAPHNPDIIFIEFTVNDDMNSFKPDRAQYRMENFLYQCSQLEKIPTVVYLHTPPATMPGSEVYNRWYKQVEYKEEWAAHYGVETINIFDYSYGKFEKEMADGGETDYIKWLDTYYGTLQEEVVGNNGKYGRYDVHGGYQLYKEAVIAALEENAAEILAPYRFMPYMHTEQTAAIERTYVVKTHDDDMFTYSEEGWDEYYEYDASIHKSGYLRIPEGRWNYPFLVSGVHQGNGDEGAYFTFTTDANSMTVYYMAALNDSNKTISDEKLNYGGKFEVYCGSALLGTVSTASTHVQPFISSTIDLQNPDNENIEITVKVTKAADAYAAYARFTSIWFGYNN